MTLKASTKIAATSLLSAALVSTAVALPAHAARPRVALRPLTIGQSSSNYVRNFNPFSLTGALSSARAAVLEPLYIVDPTANGKQTPWLATSYKFSPDLKTLTFTIRQGVKWSDGQPFSANDVLFTLNLGKTNSALDQIGLWGASGLATGVSATGNTVSIRFKQANVTTFGPLVDNLFILPAHVWSKITNPLTFAWADPVGTGPFTQVKSFSSQSYELGRNPYYWNAANLKIDAIRYTGFQSNDASALALESGQVDWSGDFINNVERVYDARNPNYHHYYAPRDLPTTLYVTATKYPYNLPVFRKALSMAINRQALNVNAEYGYTTPTNITGLSGAFPTWVDKSVPNTLAQYNPTAALSMLEKAGFKMQGGKLMDPKGQQVTFSLPVVAGFSDFVGIQQILAQNFKALGIDAAPLASSTFGPWYPSVQKGVYPVVTVWSYGNQSPYDYYNQMMGPTNIKPVGTIAGGDAWTRFQDPQMDALLTKFRTTTDAAQQHALANQMQQIFVKDLPVIPMINGLIKENYNTTYYTGFPTANNYYADGSPDATPMRLIVLTHLKPAH